MSKSYSASQMLDVNHDNAVDVSDLRHWVKDIASTWYGDANLDGKFDSSDLVVVFKADLYESQITGKANWTSGD